MNPVYTLEQLQSFNRTQLWQLCKERGLRCYPKTTDCVEAIWTLAQSVEKVAVAEIATEQPKTCADCPLFKPFNDGTGRGLCCGVADTSLVVREHHEQTQDCQNLIDEQTNTENAPAAVAETPVVQSGSITFKRVLSAKSAKTIYEVFQGADSLGLVIKSECGCWYNSDSDDYVDGYTTPYEAAAALHLHLLPTSPNLSTTEIPEIEVDSAPDPDFGEMYRVWHSYHLLGTFYQAADGKWIAQPCDSDDRPKCSTAADAQLLIVAIAGLLVADTADEAVDLLDKPFDELTVTDWEAVKQQALQAEFVAA